MNLIRLLSSTYSTKYSFVHIGKTAGNTVKSIANEVRRKYGKRLHIYPHECNIRKIFQYNRTKISFILRDPAERFISGYYSRMRNGRPLNSRIWSPREAVVFSYFPDANSFCESLSGNDERLYSAALYSLNSIRHLRRTYKFYFHSVDFLEKYRNRIYAVVDFENMNDQIYKIFQPLDVDEEFIREHLQVLHAAPVKTSSRMNELTETARKNLYEYLKDDYKIYNYLKSNFIKN